MIDPRTAPYAATLLRVGLGSMFLAHGLYLKGFVYGLAGTVGFFEAIGFPGFLAYLVFAGETAAGVFLILGIQTRLVALATLPILFGALWTHLGAGWLFSNEGGGWEYPLFLIVAALTQALLGDGRFSVRVPVISDLKLLPRATS